MTSRLEDSKRMVRTLSHLRPEQAVHRARLRGQRYLLAQRPEAFEQRWTRSVRPDAGWPASYEPLDWTVPPASGTAEALGAHTFDLLGETHNIADDGRGGWRPQHHSQLFRYNLHYFEWAWTLAVSPDRDTAREVFAELWTSWRAGTTFGRWDEWSPYVVALRSWVLCGVFDTLVRGSLIEDDVRSQIGLHAGFVEANLELDVGGNHLIKNIKALFGLGEFLNDDDLVERGRDLLEVEIDRQVLADGGHYERSAAYHCQILADFVDIGGLCSAGGRERVAGLEAAVERMRAWLGAMLMPDGDVPLFGDATLVGLDRIAALSPITPAADPLIHLAESGYVVCRPSDRLHVIIDVGVPCPPDLPAHAQAGCLAFVAAVDGERVIVDTGVSTYVGDRRSYERSTAAHNTVEVGEIDQTEVWSSFRAGRLAEPSVHLVQVDQTPEGDVLVIEASHDGYRHLPGAPVHRRRFEIDASRIVLRDSLQGAGFHRAFSRLFLAPGIDASLTDAGAGPDVTTEPFMHIGAVAGGKPVPAWIVFASVSQAFGQRQPCRSLWWEIWNDLPQDFVTEIVLREPTTESGLA